MLTQCPSCHARITLPDDKEGAKVRCTCERVFVARSAGARGSRRGPNTGLLVGGFVGALALIVVIFVARSGGEAPTPPPPAPVVAAAAPVEVDFGWRSELVQGVVAIHNAAHAHDQTKLEGMLHAARIWARLHADEAGIPDGDSPTFAELPAHERVDSLSAWARDLIEGEGKDLVADWAPYDGSVVEHGDDEAIVRVAVKPRAGGIENRWIEWRLAREGGRFKAWSWERWLSPDEAKAQKRKKGYEVVTLSDGSVVHERAPEPLAHFEDTPEELRTRIDTLVATMLDLDLTKEAARARRDLVAIGRPAIPILLTRLYEIPADTEENRIRCGLVDQSLQQITGQSFGYAPGESGSVAGTTEERRQSSIKQWFAWWYKNQKRFTEKQTTDGLEGLIELTEKEKRRLERDGDK